MYYAYIASEMFVNLNIPCCVRVCVYYLAQTRKFRETQIMWLWAELSLGPSCLGTSINESMNQ